jgi:DNA-binding response OmpR family regulator
MAHGIHPQRSAAFKMLFPALDGEPGPEAPVPVEGRPSGRETILLAEDDPGVRKYVREILERHGYTVLETSNGREALEAPRQHPGPVHLLLADAVMPEMGGLELSGQFQAARAGVRMLCMSGYSDRVWPQAETPAGYIQKPFPPAALLTRIRTLLDAE